MLEEMEVEAKKVRAMNEEIFLTIRETEEKGNLENSRRACL